MNVRYKTFANRTSQDIKLDQILRTNPLAACPSTASSSFGSPLIPKTANFAPLSPRKRVNVVSFTPSCENEELVTKSERPSPGDNNSDDYQPASEQSEPFLTCPGVIWLSGSSEVSSLAAPISPPPTKRHFVTTVSTSPQFLSAPHLMYSTKTAVHTSFVSSGSTVDSQSKSNTATVTTVPLTLYYPNVVAAKSVSKYTASSELSDMLTKTVLPTTPSSYPSSCAPSKLSFARRLDVLDRSSVTELPNKAFELSRPTVAIPRASAPVSDFEMKNRQNSTHSLLCSKKKRAAYNPRPWQQDIDPEESSSTKQPMVPTCSTSGTLPAESRRPAVQYPDIRTEVPHSRGSVLSSYSQMSHLNHTVPEVNSRVQQLVNRPQFDFPDSDGEEERNKTHISISRTKLPRLTSLIGVQSSPSPPRLPPPDPPSNIPSPKSSSIETDGEKESESELEDVKPWFCADDRKIPKKCQPKEPIKADANRVDRSQKPLYTVVRKVRDAHVCQERGETQHLLDDVEYLIDGLAGHNKTNTRALSVLTLANRCLTASFRYLVNSHGLTKRICANLHDAHQDYTLALTSAGLFYILSRDRDPNVFDAESLPVMMKLLQSPHSITVDHTNGGGPQAVSRAKKEAERVRTRVRHLLEGLQQQHSSQKAGKLRSSDDNLDSARTSIDKRPSLCSASSLASLAPASLIAGTAGLNTRHLQMTRQLTTADLVLESILNLGTRKAADWFKAGLRQGGGLDRVADAAADAVDYLADLDPTNQRGRHRGGPHSVWRSGGNPTGLDGFALDRLKRVCYYTKLLENMTYMDSDNQTYLVRYRDRLLVNRLICCVRLCASHLPKQRLPADTKDITTDSSTPVDVKPGQSCDQSILVGCVLGIFRFLVNVSHNEFASDRLGGCPGLLETVLECILHLPARLPKNKRFDLLVLTLCLLANLCEHCPENRTRLVHLDIPRPKEKETHQDGDDEDEDEVDIVRSPVCLVSALDELVQLFLVREEQARNHDFERDDEDAEAAEARRRERSKLPTFNPSTATMLDRPTHVEEAGLKWRLIEDRKTSGLFAGSGHGWARTRRKNALARRRERRRETRRRALTQLRRSDGSDEGEEEEEEEEDESSADEDEEDVSDLDDNCFDDAIGYDDDEDDESVGSGADVEFVADTQEEQEQLAERMSQAQQHMEDSVVAAYVALLLGCIIQSSRLYAEKVRGKLPDGQFRPLAIMLAKLLSFLSLTKGVGSSGSETILRIVRILEAQDNPNRKENIS